MLHDVTQYFQTFFVTLWGNIIKISIHNETIFFNTIFSAVRNPNLCRWRATTSAIAAKKDWPFGKPLCPG